MSEFAGLIAANLPGGSEVLTATGDFTSILFPLLRPGQPRNPHPGGAAPPAEADAAWWAAQA